MIDAHIHLERGDYTQNWIQKFVDKAIECELDEIWLLEHCYRFKEFLPMYGSVCAYSDYINNWFNKKAGVLDLYDFLKLSDEIRQSNYPINIKFGLEICYFEDYEDFVYKQLYKTEFDFLLGSVHYIKDFAFDHIPELWEGIDVDNAYKDYFERSLNLAKSGLFDGIAHPDCIKLFGHTPSFSLVNHYEKLAKALSDNNMYAEQNSGAHRRCPNTSSLGMDENMIKSMKKHNVKILTASDAHRPDDVGDMIYIMQNKLNEL